ncbi:MAG: hypothetical protein KDJ27_08355 [Gammaproteobacteria bacterium]|nr:hypothetical protein [Gammaproteobacteria bacterium]MCB1923743.1 hypothetical protein [Gammaproteobacteria bacterium]
MQGKVRFWLGLGLCTSGIGVALAAGLQPDIHLLAAVLVVSGSLLAIRNLGA